MIDYAICSDNMYMKENIECETYGERYDQGLWMERYFMDHAIIMVKIDTIQMRRIEQSPNENIRHESHPSTKKRKIIKMIDWQTWKD